MAATSSPATTHLLVGSTSRLQTTRTNKSLQNGAVLTQKKTLSLRRRGRSSTSISPTAVLPFDLSPPPIDHDLLETVKSEGGKISEGIIETFGNDGEALDAADNGVAVVDLSHFGRIRVSGDDRIQFLHNQSTANFEILREGQGCDTVFVTPTARTIDIAHAWIMKNAIVLVVSPLTCGSIIEMLNKSCMI